MAARRRTGGWSAWQSNSQSVPASAKVRVGGRLPTRILADSFAAVVGSGDRQSSLPIAVRKGSVSIFRRLNAAVRENDRPKLTPPFLIRFLSKNAYCNGLNSTSKMLTTSVFWLQKFRIHGFEDAFLSFTEDDHTRDFENIVSISEINLIHGFQFIESGFR